MVVSDGNIVTTKEDIKWFTLEFESVGAGTCVIMDFDDKIVEAYGDYYYCNEWAPDIEYVPGVEIGDPMEISHVY